MASPHDPTDPTRLTPEQRLDELSAILATGVARLLASRASHPVSLPGNSVENRLDVPADLGLHGARPVNANGEPPRSCR
jgi:hypothetical protein